MTSSKVNMTTCESDLGPEFTTPLTYIRYHARLSLTVPGIWSTGRCFDRIKTMSGAPNSGDWTL